MISHGIEETSAIARDFVKTLVLGNRATVVALSGDLGSGKTTFVQALGDTLGIGRSITSPTFVIAKIYKTKHPLFKNLVHIDAYRLSGEKDLEALKFKEYSDNRHNLICLEWPSRVEGGLLDGAIRINFSHVSESERQIEIMTKE